MGLLGAESEIPDLSDLPLKEWTYHPMYDIQPFSPYAGISPEESIYHFSTDESDIPTKCRLEMKYGEMSDMTEEMDLSDLDEFECNEWQLATIDGKSVLVLLSDGMIAFMAMPSDLSELNIIQ